MDTLKFWLISAEQRGISGHEFARLLLGPAELIEASKVRLSNMILKSVSALLACTVLIEMPAMANSYGLRIIEECRHRFDGLKFLIENESSPGWIILVHCSTLQNSFSCSRVDLQAKGQLLLSENDANLDYEHDAFEGSYQKATNTWLMRHAWGKQKMSDAEKSGRIESFEVNLDVGYVRVQSFYAGKKTHEFLRKCTNSFPNKRQ